MNPNRSTCLRLVPLAALALILSVPAAGAAEGAAASSGPGYVDGKDFRAMIDESQEVVEVNLEGAILQALAGRASNEEDAAATKELFGKLKSIHAVIGTVKGPKSAAFALVQALDQKLVSQGWQRITRIKDESDCISVLTHTTGDKIDGLVTLIFSQDDGELVFANLAGEIDINKLGEIGERLNVPGLDHLPGLH